MNNVDVISHFIKLSKTFSTIVTFMIFVSIMKNCNVSLQITTLREGFSQESHLWALSQESHSKSLWPSWTVLMCTLRLPAWVNDFPQESHLNFFTSVKSFYRTWAWLNDFPKGSCLWYLYLCEWFPCFSSGKLWIQLWNV